MHLKPSGQRQPSSPDHSARGSRPLHQSVSSRIPPDFRALHSAFPFKRPTVSSGPVFAKRLLFFLTVLSLLGTHGLFAQETLDRPLATYTQKVMEVLIRSAEHGPPLLQANVADMFMEGRGVPLDLKEAARFYQKAANQGLPEAAIAVAKLYFRGDALEQSHSKAFAWMRLADKRLIDPRNRDIIDSFLTFIQKQMAQAELEEGERLFRELEKTIPVYREKKPGR